MVARDLRHRLAGGKPTVDLRAQGAGVTDRMRRILKDC